MGRGKKLVKIEKEERVVVTTFFVLLHGLRERIQKPPQNYLISGKEKSESGSSLLAVVFWEDNELDSYHILSRFTCYDLE